MKIRDWVTWISYGLGYADLQGIREKVNGFNGTDLIGDLRHKVNKEGKGIGDLFCDSERIPIYLLADFYGIIFDLEWVLMTGLFGEVFSGFILLIVGKVGIEVYTDKRNYQYWVCLFWARRRICSSKQVLFVLMGMILLGVRVKLWCHYITWNAAVVIHIMKSPLASFVSVGLFQLFLALEVSLSGIFKHLGCFSLRG